MATVRAGTAAGTPIRPVVAVPGERRRRPSGEPPPLPRRLATSTRLLVVAVAVAVALEAALAVPSLRRAVTAADLAVVRLLAPARDGAPADVLGALVDVGSTWPVRALFWSTLLVLLVTRRVPHLLAYLALLLLSSLAVTVLVVGQGRMRPAVEGTERLAAGAWSDYAHPSLPVALLALVLVGAVVTLVPVGRARRAAGWTAGGVVAAVALARTALGLDHPTDVLAALALGGALPLVGLRLAVPEEAFPVRYRGGPRAHVDLGGARGAAIREALDRQLGLHVLELEPFGLSGSAGSSPLRLRVRDSRGAELALFAKLYTTVHLRSDRWYKLARMVLYGRLEDEKPFSSVRRLVEYEDHLLRLLRDAGLPVPRPYGLVEITPEREYLVVMELFDGAREIGDVELTDEEVDDGLRIVRRLWESGVAHRDLKPSNLLVRDGRVLLIDVAFAAVRPTPWRQAVDLADMMLTLALSSSAERVYARALEQFAPEDVAEAFAASRSLTVPTQLRRRLEQDGRDLAGRFRALAPPRRPVSVQLWGWRRVVVTLGVVGSVALAVTAVAAYARLADLL